MMKSIFSKVILINNTEIETFVIKLKHANLILAVAPKGFIMCGYLDLEVAEKLKDAAAVVSGVSSIEELLVKPVVKVTPQAQKLGILPGISGKDALAKMI